MVKAVIFDAFGTLIRPSGVVSPYQILAGGRLRDWRDRFLKENLSLEGFARELGAADRLPIAQQAFFDEMDLLQAYPEAPAVISALREEGIKTAICSNLAQPYGRVVKTLFPSVDGYALSYELGCMKPEPAIYKHALDEVGCQVNEAVFVGDSRRCDYLGPTALGIGARHLKRLDGMDLRSALVDLLAAD